jgi:hypothetical protein
VNRSVKVLVGEVDFLSQFSPIAREPVDELKIQQAENGMDEREARAKSD